MRRPTILFAILLAASAASGQWPKTTRSVDSSRPNFNPTDISGAALCRDDGEFLIDTSTTYLRPPHEWQHWTATAFDGSNFLVVWSDDRRGSWRGTDIFGARMAPDGTILDTAGVGICLADGRQGEPTVAFDGTNFLVAWHDERVSQWETDIYATRVTRELEVLDPGGFPVSCAEDMQYYPTVAFADSLYFLAWCDHRRGGDFDIYAARVTPQGTVLDPDGIAVSTAPYDQVHPVAAYDGTGLMVAWEDRRSDEEEGVFASRVTMEGTVLDTAGIPLSAAVHWQGRPAIAFDGTNFAVAWGDDRHASGQDIYGARVAPDGAVLDTGGIALCCVERYQTDPEIAYDGANFLVVWRDGRDTTGAVYGTRLSRQGIVLDTSGIRISKVGMDAHYPAIAFGDSSYLVLWLDPLVSGTRVTPSGEVLDTGEVCFGAAAHMQTDPAVAFDGRNFLAAWRDCRSGEREVVYASRVSPSGIVLDPRGFPVCSSASYAGCPELSFDGTNYLVVWSGTGYLLNRHVYGTRVSPDGMVLDTTGMPICTTRAANVWTMDVEFDGTSHVVVWSDHRLSSDDVYCARVSPGGVVLDPNGIPISTAERDQVTPSVAACGVGSLVVWDDDPDAEEPGVFAARLTPIGRVLDTIPIEIARSQDRLVHASSAYDGTNSLVVWTNRGAILGARVSSAGEVLDPGGFAIGSGFGGAGPVASFDGTNFVIVWGGRDAPYQDLYGARVSSAGVVVDSGPVVRQDGVQYAPAIAHGASGEMLLVYCGWTGVYDGRSYNTHRIWGKTEPLTGRSEKAAASQPKGETRMPTIVRGVLSAGHDWFPLGETGSCAKPALLDISGRKVMDLRPGPNDIRHIAPGVYFVRRPATEDGRPGTAVRKVVIQR